MNRKTMSIFLIITLIFTLVFSQATYAAENNDMLLTSVTSFDLSQENAEVAAAAFLLSDVVNNEESEWDNTSKIGEVTPMYDLNDNITAYSCQVVTGNENAGYIVVPASSELSPIVEFSYSSESPVGILNNATETLNDTLDALNNTSDKVYYTGGFNYFKEVESKGKMQFNSINNEEIDRADIENNFKVTRENAKRNNEVWADIKKVNKSDIKELFTAGSSADNTYGGAITDPNAYLQSVFMTTKVYTYDSSKSKILSYVGNWLMEDYESTNGVGASGSRVNNCTLTTLSNILIYYSINGYSKIPSDKASIYSVVRAEGVKLGYTPGNGLGVTSNDNLVDNVWKAFGCTSGSGSNDYTWSFNTLTSEINNNRPVMLSFASDPYYNHTIAVRGYATYKNGGSDYLFAVVRDNWHSGDRYISSQEAYVACATKITPPSSKN